MIAPAQSDPAAAIPVNVTRFPRVDTPAQWTDETATWGAFVAGVLAQGVPTYTAKEGAPLHALYRLRRGGRRCNEDVELVFGVCLDFDHVPVARVLECAAALQADGIALLWHTTWSHGEPLDPANPKHARAIKMLDGATIDERRRIIVPLAEPIPGASYDTILGTIWATYAEHADREAGGAHRAFYVPSCAPTRADVAELHYLPGAGLKIEASPATPIAPVVPLAAVHSISEAVWQRLMARWLRSSSARNIDLAERMRKILEGIPYAEHGERDAITWRLVEAIIHAYPEVAADSVRELFRLSIDAMQKLGSSLTEAELVEKLERARRAKLAAEDTALPDDRRDAIRQAFGTDRNYPYTADEITEIQSVVGLSREELDHAWILQYGTGHWLVGPGGKLSYASKDTLENTARVVLAPAPIELHEIGKDGRRWMTRRTLLEKYSLPLDEVSRSLTIDEPVFNLVDRRLTMPACPKRAIAPRFDPEIDRWLRLLAGDRYDQLCAWLQWVPDLTRPIAALVLTGEPSIGKSMLAQGLARIWTDAGPTKLAAAMGKYDYVLEACPFCFADEELPSDFRGHERTAELREFIQCTRRNVDRKHRDFMSLEGAARVQIAANNLSVLTLGGGLSAADVDAIAVRFLHVAGRIDAAHYLAERGGRDGVVPWVEGDGIAAHVLYLAKVKRYDWIGRFGVPAQPDLVDRMLVRGGVRAALCELFVKALRDKAPLREGARVVRGVLAVRLDWIPDAWDLFLGRRQRPETPGLLQALDGLGQRFEAVGEGWFAIETSRLVTWARESGTGNPERVHGWLRQHDEVACNT
jgi:hypothetical protein